MFRFHGVEAERLSPLHPNLADPLFTVAPIKGTCMKNGGRRNGDNVPVTNEFMGSPSFRYIRFTFCCGHDSENVTGIHTYIEGDRGTGSQSRIAESGKDHISSYNSSSSNSNSKQRQQQQSAATTEAVAAASIKLFCRHLFNRGLCLSGKYSQVYLKVHNRLA